MMESSKRSIVFLVLVLSLNLPGSYSDTKYYVKMKTNSTDPFVLENLRSGDESTRAPSQDEKSRSTFRIDDQTMIRESLKANHERRNSFVESSTFDPDVLNKFLDDYANKIKTTTEIIYDYAHRVTKPIAISTIETNKTENSLNSTVEASSMNQQKLNDTTKRNSYFGSNGNNDDHNGWVTLDAIPWSKSKISKWQANPSSQRPWPDMKIWEKPNSGKPWNSDFPSRPTYINNEPWHDSQKPYRPDYQPDRPSSRPQATRPSYFGDRFDENPSPAQKWPPERPASSWEKFPSSDFYKPNIDIITDDRPSNFPNSWDKFASSQTSKKPTYAYNNNRDRYSSNNNDNYAYIISQQQQHQEDLHQDWRNYQNIYPAKFESYKEKPPNFGRPSSDDSSNLPGHVTNYQYTPDHPPSHPSSGDGQWVLLSTNRGYSKSRQRSIKIDSGISATLNTTKPTRSTKQENDGTIAVMTSKRQVRLTVLPSVNGTNTTTSHGGLLEVEKTFKTVDQSQKEYEANKEKLTRPTFVNKRPIRNTFMRRPSNSALLAAVGAGMLPATMAMMIPMMLGRKKRSAPQPPKSVFEKIYENSERRYKLSRL